MDHRDHRPDASHPKEVSTAASPPLPQTARSPKLRAVFVCCEPSPLLSSLLRVVLFHVSTTQKPLFLNDFGAQVRVEALPVATEALPVTIRMMHHKGGTPKEVWGGTPKRWRTTRGHTIRGHSKRAQQKGWCTWNVHVHHPCGWAGPDYCRMAIQMKSRMKRAETIQTIGCTSLAFLRHTLTMQ